MKMGVSTVRRLSQKVRLIMILQFKRITIIKLSEENTKSTQSIDLDSTKSEYEGGFKKGTEKFGECVLNYLSSS